MVRRGLRLVELLRTQPDYVFGRFSTVRRVYSSAQRLARGAATDTLTITPLYDPVSERIHIASSDRVVSRRSGAEHVSRLKSGSWSDQISLSGETVAALQAIARKTPLSFKTSSTTSEKVASLDALTPERRARIAIAQISHGWKTPEIKAIAGDEALLSVVRDYLGYTPAHASIFFFWSFASQLSAAERIERNQTIEFHYDVNGYNFIYVNFYLLDTDSEGGAHVLVEGTHRGKRMRHLFGTSCMSDADAVAEFGAERIVTVEGPAGTGFFEDTSCYHKALVPTARDRLMLQIRYQ